MLLNNASSWLSQLPTANQTQTKSPFSPSTSSPIFPSASSQIGSALAPGERFETDSSCWKKLLVSTSSEPIEKDSEFLQVHLHRGLEVRVYLVEPRASKAIHPVVQRVSTVFRPDREDGRGHTLASLGRAGAAEMAVTSIARMI